MNNETGEAIDARQKLLDLARSFLGPGEMDCAQDPEQFFRRVAECYAGKGLGRAKSWCGVFVLAMLDGAGLAPADDCQWQDGSGFVLRWVRKGYLVPTKFPEPGDLVIFGPPLWHHAIVTAPVAGGLVHTIDGNVLVGREGCGARRRPVTGDTSFYSIAPLLRDP